MAKILYAGIMKSILKNACNSRYFKVEPRIFFFAQIFDIMMLTFQEGGRWHQ